MLDRIQHRVIEESESPRSSPVILVREKNGELRFCVDYWKQNDVTKRDCFPLPPDRRYPGHAGRSQMVFHPRIEERLLSNRCTNGWQGEDRVSTSLTFQQLVRDNGNSPARSHVWRTSRVPGRRDYNWPFIPRAPPQLRKNFPAVPRSPHVSQPGKVSTFTERIKVPRAYCLTIRDIYRPWKIENCGRLAKPKE
jgi:hypothetical protein